MIDAKELEAKILECNKIYYNTGNSNMTDEEYDALKAKLKELDPTSIVFHSVGAATGKTEGQFKHIHPMLSLENVFTAEDLKKYFSLAGLPPKTAIAMEDKLDGLACSLHYKNGVLDVAVTRGNGIIGEIITEQISHFPSVPKTIPESFTGHHEIRGEIMMPYEAFVKYNENAATIGAKQFISARNAAVGSINSKDPMTAAKRGCVFIAYGYIGSNNPTHSEDMDMLRTLGFFANIPFLFPFSTIDDIAKVAAMRLADRKQAGIDGIVFKVNDISLQRLLGWNNTCPKWAVAFKQNIEVAETIVEDVEWQVGRMGSVTPVARLKPVILSDALISNVTLHNWNQIQSLGLGIGDRILIVRSGGVIPKVNLVLDKAKPPVDVIKPTNCPVCKSELLDDDGMLSCTNVSGCDGIRVERMIFACSKDAMDIKGIGPEVIRHAYETKQVNTIADLFKPSAAVAFASRHPSTAEQNLPKFEALIKDAVNVDRDKAIIALCIDSISTVSARYLAGGIDRLTDLIDLTAEDLVKLNMTPVRTAKFLEYMQNPENIKLIKELDAVLVFPPKTANTLQPFAGKTYVVTGSFEKVSRKKIEETIIAGGGKIGSKVNAKTDYLFCGENAGSKLKDAEKHNVTILREPDVLAYISASDI